MAADRGQETGRRSWIAAGLGLLLLLLLSGAVRAQDQPGSLRGVVYDKDFDVPLPGAQILIVELGQAKVTNEQGNFVFTEVPPGTYTVVVSKDGYVRQVKAGVVVGAGRLTDLEASLAGEFTEMEEFLVQDVLQLGGATEAGQLEIRLKSPAIMDTISAELMSKAGASDAASAIRLVSGASLQDGKFAVIRGMPDRYVSSQMNSVRMPSADENTRAVELDQFPSSVIESIQVTKTFTPDQQGDASGGAVNLVLKSIPDENFVQLNSQLSANSQVYGEDDFLTYDGGGIDFLGNHGNDPQPVGQSWTGAVGTSTDDAPQDYKTSVTAGGTQDLDDGVKIGGLASLYYERDSSFYDNGIDDKYHVNQAGQVVPDTEGDSESFLTALYDTTQGTQVEKWGGLGSVGIETENNKVGLTYLYTQVNEDTSTLAIDTRGKQFFVPGYDPAHPTGEQGTAPYQRLETLDYTERTSSTLQLNGEHTLPTEDFSLGVLKFKQPLIDWVASHNTAKLDEPNKTVFGATWTPDNAAFPGQPAAWHALTPAASAFLGNVQHVWKNIDEESDQYSINMKLPFDQWSGDEGYLKFGVFDDQVDRKFNQDTFSNFNDPNGTFFSQFDQPWSGVFPSQDHPITESNIDVDYDGDQQVSAYYGMTDLPLNSQLKLIGGARVESTDISIVNHPEADALWFPPGTSAPESLDPGEGDVDFSQQDVLPSIGLEYTPVEHVVLRTSYSETVARQTFKELTPILQQEYAGADIFFGNPDLQMSSLENYDVRADYTPYEGGLYSASWFQKNVDQPIEYVQKPFDTTFTTPENYPQGELSGIELETRQQLGRWWESVEGLSAGVNATFIDSNVDLPANQVAEFQANGHPISSRDMTNAPEHLYNVYLSYDLPDQLTTASLFYTVTGDTLVAGDGVSNTDFVPAVYAEQYGTLNFTLSRKLGEHSTLIFQAKNLTDPEIDTVYRSKYIPNDVTKTSYTLGREFALGLSIRF